MINKEKKGSSIIDRKQKASQLLSDFENCKNFVKGRNSNLIENIAFAEGTQAKLSKYANNKPWLATMNTPHARIAIDTRVASLIATDYVGVLQPYTPDDQERIEVLNRLYSDLWKSMEADDIVSDSIEMSAIVREAYCHIIPSSKQKKKMTNSVSRLALDAYLLETSSVLLDPVARSFEDCEYIYLTGRIDRKKALGTYSILKQYEDYISDSSSPEDRGEINIGNDFVTNQEDALLKITKYVKEHKDGDITIKQYLIIGGILVEESTLEGFSTFPIAQLRWRKASQSAYGLSLMDDIIELQKAINAIESAVTNSAIAYSNPQYVIDLNSGLNVNQVARSSGMPGVAYGVKGDVNRAIKVLSPPVVDDKSVLLKNQFENSISQIAGISGQFIGAIGTAGNTAQGASLSIERAKIVEMKVFKNIKDYVEQMTRIIVNYISTYYEENDNLQMRNQIDHGSVQFEDVSIPDLTELNFSFYIDIEKKTFYSKEKESLLLKELYQYERQYKAPVKLINELDILKSFGLTDDEVYVNRYKQLQINNAEQKATTSKDLIDLGAKYRIPEEMIKQALVEVLNDDDTAKKTVAQVLQMAEQIQQQMDQNIEQSNQEAMALGIPQETIQQVQEETDVTPEMLGM